VKTIPFRFPMYYNDNNKASRAVCLNRKGNFLPRKNRQESVVALKKILP